MLPKNALGGIMLIAGTAIGAAVLALPVETASLGFLQSLAFYCFCWLFMTLGALYLLEANLAIGYGTNLISIASETIGPIGKYITWAIYLFLFYALMAAYLSGAGTWIAKAGSQLGLPISLQLSAIISAIITLLIIWVGTHLTDWINRILVLGLILAFGFLVCSTILHINPEFLFLQEHSFSLQPIPIIITAFGFAIVIPTLTDYLHGNAEQLCKILIIGSLIPISLYIIWELILLGIIPISGDLSLLAIKAQGSPATDIPLTLKKLSGQTNLGLAAGYFSIFALTSSLLGVSISLFDFLADGLHVKKTFTGRLFIAAITFVPPLLFISLFPQGFSYALSFAGIFVSLLLGILPIIMVWQLRYVKMKASPLRILGGKPLMIITVIFFVLVIAVEIFNQIQILLPA